jgi:hypothetical protein
MSPPSSVSKNKSRKQREAGGMLATWFTLISRLTFSGLHDVISQKTELFIISAVRTSDPTILKLN